MRALIIASFVGAAALAAGSAYAQQATAPAGPVNAPASSQVDTAPAGGFASSDTLGDASKMKAGDANVVSNGPVPDTRENRAQFGRPMSQAGRHTAPAGN